VDACYIDTPGFPVGANNQPEPEALEAVVESALPAPFASVPYLLTLGRTIRLILPSPLLAF
jgi:hypothetical protein